jgi:hypothetical protein
MEVLRALLDFGAEANCGRSLVPRTLRTLPLAESYATWIPSTGFITS